MELTSTKVNLSYAIFLAVIHFTVASTEFSSDPIASTYAFPVASKTARSETECLLKCESANAPSCLSAVFVPETKVCLMSASNLTDFSSFYLGSGVAFRRKRENIGRAVYVQNGNRLFRVIQQRFKGNLSFARNWTEYENGFGDDTDFWLGLKAINQLTPSLLRVEAVSWSNVLYVCEYGVFTVQDASTSYQMTVSSYLTASSNMSSDSLTSHSGKKFSTLDRDNDASSNACSTYQCGGGGWWYWNCAYTNPSGLYYTSAISDLERAMFWQGAAGYAVALKSIRLMLLV